MMAPIQTSDASDAKMTPILLVSDAFWRNRLGADRQAVGHTITIRRTAYTIVGVLPPTFTGIVVGEAPDVWLPLMMQPAVVPGSDWLTQPPGVPRRTMFLHVVGRLHPGVALAQADASVNLTFRQNLDEEAQQVADPTR